MRRAAGWLAGALVCGAWGPAAAHHVPGHGASEGVRTINSLNGAGGRANTRLMVQNEFVYTRFGLNPGLTDTLSLFGEWAPRPWVSIGASAPLVMFRAEDTAGRTRVGYGDTRVQLRFTPHARKLIHRVVTLGLNGSIPTRTIKFTVDPGPIVAVAPYVVFTRTYDKWYWQVLGISTFEHRRAGTAIDVGVSGQVGARLVGGKLNLGFGALVDTRAATWCAAPGGGSAFCAGNRAGELYRELGVVRGTALTAVAWNFAKRSSLVGSFQVPLTARRDYTLGWSLGVQVFF